MLVVVAASSNKASISRGSNIAPSRARFGVTPSIQIVSELTWKNGSAPSSGNAFTTPPPVSSGSLRSSEMTIFGRVRGFTCFSIVSAK
jgi:hypothetical protein